MNINNLKQHLEEARKIAVELDMKRVEKSILKTKGIVPNEIARKKCMNQFIQIGLIPDPDAEKTRDILFKKWGASRSKMYDR